MRVVCAGSNTYGQFRNSQQINIRTFKEDIYENTIDVQICHSFIMVKRQELDCDDNNTPKIKLEVHGCLNAAKQMVELDFENEEIIQEAVNSYSAFFLNSKGTVWELCSNSLRKQDFRNGIQFDKDTASNTELPVTQDEITKISVPKHSIEEETVNDKIIKIAGGSAITCAYTEQGYIYNIPSKLQTQMPNVKDICCGTTHCLVLTEDGCVYSFGCGSRGQLGHGDVEKREEPVIIDALCGIEIVKIACGFWHSAALSSQGDLYMWGSNSNGQLGLKTNKNTDTQCLDVSIMASPCLIDFDVNVVDVACGSKHTIALLENSKLYGCGFNKYCQLGLETSDEDIYKMIFLHDFTGQQVTGIRCGPWNSVVLLTD